MKSGLYVALAALGPLLVLSDTPANCTFEDVEGSWMFYESDRNNDNSLDCEAKVAVVSKTRMELKYPDVAVDQFGNIGTWTMIYNQGFEVTVAGRTYFAFSDFTQHGDTVVSYCSKTKAGQGWSHDVTVRNWACFTGKRIEEARARPDVKIHTNSRSTRAEAGAYSQSQEDAVDINSRQSSWTATVYPHLQQVEMASVVRMMGGERSVLNTKPRQERKRPHNNLPNSNNIDKPESYLPESWDWRQVNGVNYVSDVRNQGGCGSCYAFSSMGMLEARIKILTNNTVSPVFSTQDVVSCSKLSQGCEGGFPYLVAGRYAKDFGFVDESCNPYVGKDGACSTKKCPRHYASSYRYVGGYYGGCSEEAMMRALVENGPLSVSFEVYDDFMMYKSGVYHHTGALKSKQKSGAFYPFEVGPINVTLMT